ncbi:hypothetical protein [Croceibacterium ferulae]|nr:hypothetical protein [Croceibacterium ferulae]
MKDNQGISLVIFSGVGGKFQIDYKALLAALPCCIENARRPLA